ncbi:sigma-70 family RNA polymerase sigma factor [Janthinobacterium fluminis]|uniref:Sigma-70 family RNA polymerase sigma factor n=1 Tax=Janthinobacterium fluminis TaxID=2987524 RepID=A0ABT5JW43_9BURK|nr:sigma-70 family RNA polymerase sigma factor [Janthinobacterium fluminis]MDC8756948.1 sigma-70 family RNA polymerase sigma factor [Janthinobacterium fluminis]
MSAADTSLQAIQVLYSEHHGWLRGWLHKKMGNAFDAADLAQSTFLRLLTAQGLERVQEPRAYLTAIARNLLINHVRRRAIEQAYLDALALLPEPVAPPPEVRLMFLETLLEVDRRLDGLPGLAKQAFFLAQLEGMGQVEIAAELGISLSTVKRHLAKAAMRCFFPA